LSSEDQATATVNRYRKFVKFGRTVCEISEQTDIQTDDTLIAVLRPAGEVIIVGTHRHTEEPIARPGPLKSSVKAKFHSLAGSKLVADQLRTSFELASVMEFGFN